MLIDEVSLNNKDEASQKVHEIVSKARAEREREARLMLTLEKDKENAEALRKKQAAINEDLEQRLSNSEKKLIDAINTLDNQSDEIKRLRRANLIWVFVLIGVIVAVACYFLLQIESITGCLRETIKWIMRAGGLWAFCNLLINAIGKLKK